MTPAFIEAVLDGRLSEAEALLGVVLPSMFIVALATKYVHRG